MYPAIETLKDEHRIIERVLGSLEAFADGVEGGAEAERSRVRDFADFFKNFADRCHHGKEEDRLFALMVDHGFPSDYGPVAVMLAEHVQGREHVGALARVGGGEGPLSPAERDEVVRSAGAYIALLRAHIQKEDNILYPMAEQAVPPEKLEALEAEFEAFEETQMGPGTHERYHHLVERLSAAYPPDPCKMAAGAACVGCAGHM